MFDSLNARLDAIQRDGVKVELTFPLTDYAYMGLSIFAGLLLALVLAHVITKAL
jgi:hypothetical protein